MGLNTITPLSWTQILGTLVVFDTLKCFHKKTLILGTKLNALDIIDQHT